MIGQQANCIERFLETDRINRNAELQLQSGFSYSTNCKNQPFPIKTTENIGYGDTIFTKQTNFNHTSTNQIKHNFVVDADWSTM